ncbi:glycoside hydrolase family 43 protein [Flavilitoribacter nigricans]|uniref:Glycoside hydrolase n=1 Tax=Flavilitoribacter nigricans (strain ATCC 23147 / DSM 23189 / NBRC 102662 / NCIMB 1420 / SS-2) TaxID=1122177 RepID=A0A2D0MZC5_FLAN2|nr:glycoside hydrolase 43 family protein [Flavilitoribacter nigricans]PHN01642.1 glycoside hydrolase [Flavilitoribacter nigricans DSM 23189 = NBRC 102662]
MSSVLKTSLLCISIILGTCPSGLGQVYQPDLGNGRYQNPIIHADYSDPDVVRVGEDFFMVSSSFNCVPGLPLLHSKDLVNWEIVNYVIQDELPPGEVFDQPQHGNGVWAPSIRYHAGWYYVFYGDPDFGIYRVRTRDPWGKWEKPHLVKAAKGWIDPCPFWDEDGNAYLVHAFAGSRAGVKSVLILHRMDTEAIELLDDGVLVFDGHANHPTIEGPKMYKRNGYYYIFAPGGGVELGWQTVLRSKNIYGPYEDKIVLETGDTEINGPHQGAWVELANGESWFIHFQDKRAYGRIVHLQPAVWKDDWIVIGQDKNGDGTGNPVLEWQKPNVGRTYPRAVPQTSDEFNHPQLGRQWQWHGNPKPTWIFPTNNGTLRMNPVILDPARASLWEAPNLLLQKFPAESFTATTKLDFTANQDSETIGLIVMGLDYAYIGLKREGEKLFLIKANCKDTERGGREQEELRKPLDTGAVHLRVSVREGGKCTFAYSLDGQDYRDFGNTFTAREGKWIGAKVGLFSVRDKHQNDGGYTDIDWFRITE